MSTTDQDFREEFKPLHIPSSYNNADSEEDRIIFALATLGEGSSEEVFSKLRELDPNTSDLTPESIESLLNHFYDKGLLKGNEQGGKLVYNLSKITDPNKGYVDPGLLAPGLD